MGQPQNSGLLIFPPSGFPLQIDSLEGKSLRFPASSPYIARKKERQIVLDLRLASRPFFGFLLASFLFVGLQQDEQKQTTSPPPAEDEPASIGLLLDNSYSMVGKLSMAVGALKELVKASNPKDEFFVVNFNDDPYLDADFTSDSKSIFEALGKADARSGTSINDTVIAAADHLEKGAKYKKRIIVLVTDGIDNTSHVSFKKMLRKLHQPGMPIVYAIGLFQYEGLGARKALDLLTQETGGRAFYAENEKQLNEMARQVAQEIRALKPTMLQDDHSDSAVKH